MSPTELITTLKNRGELDKWLDVFDEEDSKFAIEGAWANKLIIEMEQAEDQMTDLVLGIWNFGLQAFDWSYFYDLMLELKNKSNQTS